MVYNLRSTVYDFYRSLIRYLSFTSAICHLAFYILFSCCLLPTVASATHLMGGSTGYKYLGLNQITGNYKYQATVKVYRYCDDIIGPCGSNTCNTAGLDPSIELGVYTQDFLNPNNPNKSLAVSFSVPLTSSSWVPLPGAAQCATAPTVCVEEGIYTMQIELPPSNGGYHLIFQRCCRNWNIINLANPGAEGQTYYAFIPPTFINNSSPTFAQPPVPYICANDTASILNTAFDPDGDVVIYSLVQPYGVADSAPAPPPPNSYVFPIPLVTYASGFSAAQPFGAGGYAAVNAFTGLSQYLSPNTGYYVVAVELKEYRNNQLIGITRLDIQIIVITCPPNNAPRLAPTTLQTSYSATEGDSLCFPIKFNDANGDSVFFNATGNIFSNPPTNPLATVTPNPNSGHGTLTSQFCWDMACSHTGNFIFIVQVPDNGCPPKITNVVYTIQVLPYTGPSFISGPTLLCENSLGTYSVPSSSGTSFSWTVTGGIILSGQGTNNINVNWGSAGNRTMNVTSYNSNGCSAGPITLNVSIQPTLVVNAGSTTTICTGNSVTLTSTGGGTYSWSPSTGLSNANISNPVATPTISTTYTVFVTPAVGCTNTGTVSITVNPKPMPNAGPRPGWVCPGFNITLNAFNGITYAWSPSASLSNPNISNPVVTPTIATTYTVNVTDANGCTNLDTLTIQSSVAVPIDAGNNPAICFGKTATIGGAPTAPVGATYQWSPSAGLNNSTLANPVASPVATTIYTVTVSSNTCNNVDTVTVFINNLPLINAGTDVSVCTGDSAALIASGGINYSWSTNATTTSILVSPTSFSTYTVIGTDANGCENRDSVSVLVNALPVISAGIDVSICVGDSAPLTGSGGQTYLWSTSATTKFISIAPTSSATYVVIGTDSNGCENRDSVSVLVNALPVVSAGIDVSICVGNSATLTGSGATAYLWSTGATTTTIVTTVTAAATYTVVGTDANGCSNTDFVLVSLGIIPAAKFGYSLSLACEGMEAQFKDSSQNAFTWTWNFGDGAPASSLRDPTHTFPYNSNYVITLTVANPPCFSTEKKTISISDLAAYLSIQTANVFTPNNDGVNDCFQLDMNTVPGLMAKFEGCADLTVYDRWGVPVYHSDYSGSCWDGYTTAGAMVPAGTYFYMFDLSGIQLKGFVTVLR